jgi:hypothetical protein
VREKEKERKRKIVSRPEVDRFYALHVRPWNANPLRRRAGEGGGEGGVLRNCDALVIHLNPALLSKPAP